MSRKPPDFTEFQFDQDGGLEVRWQVDTAFPEPEAPDDVLIEIPGVGVRSFGADARSIEFTSEQLGPFRGRILTLNVAFKWTGPPDEVLWNAWGIPVPGSGGGGHVGGIPAKPSVTLTPYPQTLNHHNRIKVAWSSYSYSSGEIVWGPQPAPQAYKHGFAPSSAVYHGEWTTNQQVVAGTPYTFTVRVKSSFHGTSAETHAGITAAANHRSVRRFLADSGRPGRSLRQSFGSAGRSFRRAMGV